jgi:hypothetical protein
MGDETYSHDDEIENIPGIPEIIPWSPPAGKQFQNDLNQKDIDDDLIDQVQ